MYTDPGSGLFFLQIIMAALSAIVYRFSRIFTGRLTFTRSSKPNSKTSKGF